MIVSESQTIFKIMVLVQHQLKEQNLGQVLKSRSGCMNDKQCLDYESKLSNLKLNTQPKHVLGSHSLYLKLD
jgi:hypothetical protein